MIAMTKSSYFLSLLQKNVHALEIVQASYVQKPAQNIYSYLSNRQVYQLSMQGNIFEKKS